METIVAAILGSIISGVFMVIAAFITRGGTIAIYSPKEGTKHRQDEKPQQEVSVGRSPNVVPQTVCGSPSQKITPELIFELVVGFGGLTWALFCGIFSFFHLEEQFALRCTFWGLGLFSLYVIVPRLRKILR